MALKHLFGESEGDENGISEEDAEALFQISDLNAEDDEEGLDVKEFIVLCTVGFVLADAEGTSFIAGSKLANDKDFRGVMMDILKAYLIFDRSAKGYIEEADLAKMLTNDFDDGGATQLLLTDERWKELDVDGSGRVDFQEFVYAFYRWCSLDEDDDDEEEEIIEPGEFFGPKAQIARRQRAKSIYKVAPTIDDSLSPIERRILLGIRATKDYLDQKGEKINFQRIVLRFQKIHDALDKVREAHEAIDVDKSGKIELSELHMALKHLFGESEGDENGISEEDAEALFQISDLNAEDDEEGLDVKEFIVLCTVGFVLADAEGTSFIAGSKLANDKDFRGVMMDILKAYLIFDRSAKGYIEEADLAKMLTNDFDDGGATQLLLTDERWKELDVDGSGRVDFQEFVYAFSQWCSLEDDDDEEDE